MSKKEMLVNCRRAYLERGCKLIEITHNDGCKSGIVNPKAIQIVLDALIEELDKQIAACAD